MRPPLRQGNPDDFQTPPHALGPLLPYLNPQWRIWECASGNENLVNELRCRRDFLTWQPRRYDCIITNPPFRYKQEFLERCYQLRKPFALLLPLTTFETTRRQRLFKRFGIEVIFLNRRINFQRSTLSPNSCSWFATAWFTANLQIGTQLSFETIQRVNHSYTSLSR